MFQDWKAGGKEGGGAFLVSTRTAANSDAETFFDGLSYSHRRRLVLAVEGAKAADTRARRIEKTVAMLAEGRAQ